jgi:two-component system, LytTR family, response regulator
MGTPYKCLIVDDEKPAHLVIKSHLSHCEDLEFTASAYNGKEALNLLINNAFDFVFLDIEMPLINGIELLQTLPKRPATIITTAYSTFAFEAYQQDAVDYLLKPISFPRFLKAIEKAKYFWKSNQEPKKVQNSILLRIDGAMKAVKLDQIAYFQSIGNYVKVYLNGNQKSMVVYDTLKNIVDMTPSERFVQTHKSYIANIDYIEMIGKESISLKEDVTIPLGRKYELMVQRIANLGKSLT